jgi:hypothetical protein
MIGSELFKTFDSSTQPASPGKITRGGGSTKKIQKIGSPMLPAKKTVKKQRANIITRFFVCFYKTKLIPSTQRFAS